MPNCNIETQLLFKIFFFLIALPLVSFTIHEFPPSFLWTMHHLLEKLVPSQYFYYKPEQWLVWQSYCIGYLNPNHLVGNRFPFPQLLCNTPLPVYFSKARVNFTTIIYFPKIVGKLLSNIKYCLKTFLLLLV